MYKYIEALLVTTSGLEENKFFCCCCCCYVPCVHFVSDIFVGVIPFEILIFTKKHKMRIYFFKHFPRVYLYIYIFIYR